MYKNLYNLPISELVVVTFPLNSTGRFSYLIANDSNVFTTRDQTAQIKDKLTKNDFITAMQPLTVIIWKE